MYQWKREYNVDPINCMSMKGIKIGEINKWVEAKSPEDQKGRLQEWQSKILP